MGHWCTERAETEIHSSDPEVSEVRPGFQHQFFSFILLGSFVLEEKLVVVRASSEQACGHPLQQTSSAPPLQFKWCHRYPVLHHPWQQVQADVLPFASTPARERYPSSRETCGGSRIRQNSLQRACLFFKPIQTLRSVNFRLSSEAFLPVERSI